MAFDFDPDLIEQETYGDLRPYDRREWLLTNGLGGYAAGTVLGVNTRRYHAGLVASTQPPVGRVVAVPRFEAVMTVDGRRYDPWAAYFRGELAGEGVRLLRRFALGEGFAEWEYDADGTKLFHRLFVCWRRNAACAIWQVVPAEGVGKVDLAVTPFLALRGYHRLLHAGDHGPGSPGFDVTPHDDGATIVRRDRHLHLRGDVPFEAKSDWYYAHTYPMEAARGMDDREDLFSAGTFRLSGGTGATLTVWMQAGVAEPQELDLEEEVDRRARAADPPRPAPTPVQRRLFRAAGDFVVKRHRPDGTPGLTILSGYPWSTDWGRDVFVALPGLLLTTGRHDLAGQVLTTFAAYVDGGMIPNRFDDADAPSYDTADASLWFVDSAFRYLEATRDCDTFESLLRPACEAIADGYRDGTRHGIGVDPADGLVRAGDGTVPVTWMEATVDGGMVTPRVGKPVEVNALWHNALRLLGRDDEADRVAASFARFALGEGRGLADVLNDDGTRDESLRPNQIFAVSLRHSPLEAQVRREVVDVVRRGLLTPYGLRTLGRGHREYADRYTGPPERRARSAHNGPVWPWLIGPFLDAHLRIHDRSPESQHRARTWLRPLVNHLDAEGCLGGIGEVFDPEWPYRPGGSFQQAWSVAEVLRLAVELEL